MSDLPIKGMNQQNDIMSQLAPRLKEARKAKGLSLDQVAKLSGVSRSMLSQIERGESSPTVATLWNLTRALQVDFAGLLDSSAGSESPIAEVMRSDRTPSIDSQGDGCRIRILSPPDQAGKHEVYEIAFKKGGALISDPHRPGCREHLTVLEGAVSAESDGVAVDLATGDTARYAADRPHAIRAKTGAARVLLIVENS